MEKINIRAVILVLSSHDQPIYKLARSVWKNYYNLDESIMVHFVYGKVPDDFPKQDESDLIYNDIVENYNPGMLMKTIRAMADLHTKYNYDYFIRTNISTFWDFKSLHRHLDVLPTSRCYSGDGPLNGKHWNMPNYLSGVDTIVTPDMIEAIIAARETLHYHLVPEDCALGEFFHGRIGAKMLPNRICFMEDFGSFAPKYMPFLRRKVRSRISEGQKSGADHYRVKSLRGNRLESDTIIFQELLSTIYGIKFP